MKIVKNYLLIFLFIEINYVINFKKDFIYVNNIDDIKSCGVCFVYIC